MQTQKINVTETIATIEKNITEVNHEIERIIKDEGLDTGQIQGWIDSLNNIIRKTDRSVEALLESQSK